ncbi:MAG: hypothetical protein ACRDYC_11165, partial [Acidimicrobiales bacterium]
MPERARTRPYNCKEGDAAGSTRLPAAHENLGHRSPNPTDHYKERLYEAIVPTAIDRVVQASLKLVLEPIFEADFQPCSYGFRPRRRSQDAIAEIH